MEREKKRKKQCYYYYMAFIELLDKGNYGRDDNDKYGVGGADATKISTKQLTVQGKEWPEEVGLKEQLGEHLKDHCSNVEEQHSLVAAVPFTELYRMEKKC